LGKVLHRVGGDVVDKCAEGYDDGKDRYGCWRDHGVRSGREMLRLSCGMLIFVKQVDSWMIKHWVK
jgi:hypothetical protein